MSILDIEATDTRARIRVGDAYEVTKKPRGLDVSSVQKIPFAPMDAIPSGGAYEPQFTMKTPTEIKSGTYFERGDILVAKITPSFENGKQAIVSALPTRFGFTSTEIIPLRPRKNEHDRRLLFFYLLHPDIRHYIAERMEGTTGRQRVPEDVLLDLPFPCFDPKEQTTISDALEMVQRLIAIESQSACTIIGLKQAAMQMLFTQGVRRKAQKDTEIGPMPENWDTQALAVLCEKTDTVHLQREGKRIIEYVDVSSVSREFLTIEATTRSTLQEAPGRARKRILEGDVIFATVRPTLLRTAYISAALNDQVCSTAFCVLRRNPKKAADKFLYYLVQRDSFIRQLGAVEKGASYPAVTDRVVKEQLVPVPGLEEQRRIVKILDSIDKKIDLHQRKRAVLKALFETLLHKFMIGQIRVANLTFLASR